MPGDALGKAQLPMQRNWHTGAPNRRLPLQRVAAHPVFSIILDRAQAFAPASTDGPPREASGQQAPETARCYLGQEGRMEGRPEPRRSSPTASK